jgi:UDP-N-acetylmuramoyl-tripeptide--D-alanyl-D-alanine ligase
VRFDAREIPFSFTARHQAANAVAALTVVDALGLPLPEELVEVDFSRWRCEESPLPGGGLLVNDAYNANPASMRAALEHLAERAGSRRMVAVLGDMAELGEGAPRFHEEIGAFARDLGVGVVVGVGPLARGYAPDEWAADAAAAIALVRAVVAPGDTVLVKASRTVGLEVVADALAGVPAQ